MQSLNVSKLETVTESLNELNKNVVYIGGAVAELYVIDSNSFISYTTQNITFL